jgi:integrase
LLLTGQRREKVVTMKWDDIVGGVWHIPSEAREKTSAGTLRLPAAVLDIVAAQLRIAGTLTSLRPVAAVRSTHSASARKSSTRNCHACPRG